ncbi:MAG: DinB family protein [Gemmatimonadaceae bacterium]|nr:DinB family protein [Gemmatimonadaceae bacterium]
MKRFWKLGITIVIVPITLAAQQGVPSPPPNTTVLGSFRDFGGHYGGLLLAAFDSIPARKYDFRPTPVQQTVGYIAQHLEHANYALCAGIGGLRAPIGPKDSISDTIKSAWPKDTLVARLRASLQFCARAFAQVNDAQLTETVALGSSSSDSVTRVRALLFFTTDLAEHYSQVASYMRFMGLVPPSALRRPDH